MTALDESIEKWRLIWGAGGIDKGPKNCSLCIAYWDTCDCMGCDVFKKTNHKYCRHTPYIAWSRHTGRHYYPRSRKVKIGCKECSKLAFEQYRFMRNLKN